RTRSWDVLRSPLVPTKKHKFIISQLQLAYKTRDAVSPSSKDPYAQDDTEINSKWRKF
ncbi:mCG145054, partial [Mus musculus]